MSQTEPSGTSPISHYALLGRELWRRTREPLGHPSFVLYVFVAIVIFGACGVWIELYSYFAATGSRTGDGVRTAILTFFPSLAAAAGSQLVWNERLKRMRALAFAMLTVLIVAALLLFQDPFKNVPAAIGGTICSILATWMWWVANADERSYLDEPTDPAASVGGSNPAVALSGNLNDFRVE